MKILQVRTSQKIFRRYLLAITPALALVAISGIVSANTFKPKTARATPVASKPQVRVNGHDLNVPDNGTVTQQQGNTKTTVTHQSANSSNASTDATTTTTTGDTNSLNLSVTSGGSSENVNHSQVNITTSGTTSSHSSVRIFQRQSSSVEVSP